MKRIFFSAALLLVLACCLACAASAPTAKDFAGTWVVDMAASELLNPKLKDREEMREFMAQITMIIDMEKHELAIQHAQETEAMVMPFTITQEAPGALFLAVNDGPDKEELQLELKGKALTFRVKDDINNRDTFVFVPAK